MLRPGPSISDVPGLDIALATTDLLINVDRKFHALGGGLRPGVSVAAGLACELILGFCLHVIVLWSMSAPLLLHQALFFSQSAVRWAVRPYAMGCLLCHYVPLQGFGTALDVFLRLHRHS